MCVRSFPLEKTTQCIYTLFELLQSTLEVPFGSYRGSLTSIPLLLHMRMLELPFLPIFIDGTRFARTAHRLVSLHCPIEIPFGSCIGEPHSHSVYSSTANVTVVPIFSILKDNNSLRSATCLPFLLMKYRSTPVRESHLLSVISSYEEELPFLYYL